MLQEQKIGTPVARELEARDPSALLDGKFDRGEQTLVIAPEKLVEVCRWLKEE